MSTEMKKVVKRVAEHPMQVELQELNKLTRYVIEQRDLLSQLDATSLDDFEKTLNSKTNFVKASLSAEALGLEAEHYRLNELERILDGKLKDSDVDVDGKITENKVKEVELKHTIFYTEQELKLLKQLNKVVDVYNALPIKHRNKVVITRSGEMMVNPNLNRY